MIDRKMRPPESGEQVCGVCRHYAAVATLHLCPRHHDQARGLTYDSDEVPTKAKLPQWGVDDLWRYVGDLHTQLDVHAAMTVIEEGRDQDEDAGEAMCTTGEHASILCQTHALCDHNLKLLFPDNKRVHALLYLILLRHMPSGVVDGLIVELEDSPAASFEFLHHELSTIAARFLARLMVIPHEGACPAPNCKRTAPHLHPPLKL